MAASWPGRSHVRIARPAPALGGNPGDVLIRVLDIAGLAVHAVLRVDHVARRTPLLHPFIDPGRAIARRRTAVDVVLGGLLEAKVRDPEVWRLVLLVIGVGEEHRGEPVEGELAVGLGIGDRRALGGWFERGAVRLAML